MKSLLGLAFVAFGLVGCEQVSTAPTVDNPIADDVSLSRAELIMPGMTRNEVLKILGPSDGNLGRPPKWPICDEFLYVNDGEERAVAVWYQGRKVDRVNVTAHSRCEIH